MLYDRAGEPLQVVSDQHYAAPNPWPQRGHSRPSHTLKIANIVKSACRDLFLFYIYLGNRGDVTSSRPDR